MRIFQRSRYRSSIEPLESRNLMTGEPTGLFGDAAQLVADIDQTAFAPMALLGAEMNDRYLVLVNDGIGDYEVWQTDGKGQQTTRVDEIFANVPRLTRGLEAMRVVGDQLFVALESVGAEFDANDGFIWTGEAELWGLSTKPDSANLIRNLGQQFAEASYAIQMEEQDAQLILSSVLWQHSGADGQVIQSDGTPAGTKSISSQLSNPFYSPIQELVQLGDSWFFLGANNEKFGLYETDPGRGKTSLIRSLPGDVLTGGPNRLIERDGTLYFFPPDGDTTMFWESDGTREGTIPNSSPDLWQAQDYQHGDMVGPNTRKFADFGGDTISAIGGNVYRQEPGSDTRDLLFSLPKTTRGIDPQAMVATDSGLLFVSRQNGTLHWVSETGTTQLPGDHYHFGTDEEGSRLSLTRTAVLGDSVLLFGQEGLHRVDPKTQEVELLAPGLTTIEGESEPHAFIGTAVANNKLYFVRPSAHQDPRMELWESDGTSNGTRLLNDEVDAGFLFQIENEPMIRVIDGQVFLTGNNGTLWSYDIEDGSMTGHEMDAVTDIHKLDGELIALRNKWGNNSRDLELWKDDEQNTGMVKFATIPTSGRSKTTNLASIGERILFGDGEGNLWKTDGTEIGTDIVRSFPSRLWPLGNCCEGVAIDNLTTHEDTVFFTVDDGENGNEVWVTDGTTEGTKLAVDIRPGHNSSNPTDLTISDDTLYFAANDGQHGREVWSINLATDTPTKPGDINNDHAVDFADFLILSKNFGQNTTAGAGDGDIDENGVVDFADFLILSANFGK